MVRWLPLESNPAVMNKFMGSLGVPGSWQIQDVYGLDDDLLAIVPQPVAAVLLLYPINDKHEQFKATEEEGLDSSGQTLSDKVFFMKQFVGNACGTVALIHAVANNVQKLALGDGPLKTFLDKCKELQPEARGHLLEEDDGISKAHEESAHEGQTQAPDREAKMDTHFIALVEVDGTIYELDGRKKFPINHGATTTDTFLHDAAGVCKKFIERDPEETRYAIVALSAAE